MPARISDAEREAIAADLRAEMPRNQVMAKYGRSAGLISAIAREIGHVFDRAETKSATVALRADMATRRADLARRLLARAEKLERSLDEAHVAFNFGGKDNTYNEHEFGEPDVNAARTIITTMAIAIDKHLKLVDFDADPGQDGARSLLDAVVGALTSRHGNGDDLVTDE